MSDPSQPVDPRRGPATKPSAAWTVLLFAAGIALLLPGICTIHAIIFLLVGYPRTEFPLGLDLLWAACLAVSLVGILFIRRALRRIREGRGA